MNIRFLLMVIVAAAGCASSHGHHGGAMPGGHGASHEPSVLTPDQKLDRVASVHGEAGPWAVAGYRMGEYALQKLGARRLDMDVEVTHISPREVKYSCIGDGAAAATGASPGKLNFFLSEGKAEDLATRFHLKSGGKTIVLRPTDAFRRRYGVMKKEDARKLGAEVLALSDNEIFEELPAN
ncbi:MAG: hypothetical protein GMKNLPBB_01267 [Myxococcota bacterium]|nr:hypothetical protein [Myxococcota bacterium]